MVTMLKLKKIIFFAPLIGIHFLSFAQGKIIMNGATMNMQNSVYVVTTDVSLTNPSSLNVNNSTIKISGNISSNNNINVQSGTVEMNGSSLQTIPATSFTANKIKNLIISNHVNLLGEDSLTRALSFGAVDSKTFSTGGYLTLKSTAAGTAIVADLTNNDVNTGNQVLGEVNVERYLSAVKKWRFLTVPASTAQTVKAAWQEACGTNVNCLGNYGTQITGPGGMPAGFDVYTAAPSMKTYNPATNGWTAIPNTNSYLINTLSNNTIAYMVFVRGDRTATAYNSPVTSTTLRTKGVIKQGDQAIITIASPATAFTAVGNPYPSYIDLRKLAPAPTTATKIYVWDALSTNGSLYGFGAYQTLTYDGSAFTVTPGGGSYGAPYNQDPNRIESGSAFLVGGNAGAYNITFHEDIKPSGNGIISAPIRRKQYLQANLFTNNNGAILLMDGIKADIGDDFLNVLDDNDAYKILNSSENVSLKRNGKLLSVERHHTIAANDTFYLNLTNMRAQAYQWQLNMENMDQPGLSGFLEDTYTNSRASLDLNGSNATGFVVTNVAGSYAANRFRVVFAQAKVLALTSATVKAYRQNTGINVEWKVENESNIKQYEVEKSTDGNSYSKVNKTAAKNTALSNYNWLDANAVEGYNYYRIKSIDVNGKIEYSKVVKVFIGISRQEITVYPNPVKGGIINLQFNNEPKGIYGIRLLNKLGEVMISRQINHTGGNSTETIRIDNYSAHGTYQLELTKPDGNKVSVSVIY